jgi:hypothetical protein
VRDVGRDDGGPRPIQVPAVIDGNDRVIARNHTVKGEGAVKVALVPAKELRIFFRIFVAEGKRKSNLPPAKFRF